jgi:phosphoglycolate phosphatase-like HAD superfamily hydrolase
MGNTKTESQPTVIFDFDGTLADTLVASIRIFEKLSNRKVPFNDEEIAHLRGLTAFNVVRELRIRPWRVPWLLVRGRAMMRREMETIKVFADMETVLAELKQAGVPMYIMSSNSPGNIRRLLEAHGWDGYFKRVYGNVGIFGKTKMLRRIIARNQLMAQTAYYVGDEGRDIEAAKRAGMHSVAVSWGFNSAALLQHHHPAEMATTPAELSAIFRRLLA